MSLTLTIVANVLTDIALLGGLAYTMSLPRRLTPHASTGHARRTPAPLHAAASAPARQSEQVPVRLAA